MVKAEVIDQLTDWIEPSAIAEAVLETLEDQGITASLENAKEVYLDFLANGLADGLAESCKNFT